MVRKATDKAVATKKVTKVKAAPKARPTVVYSTTTIELPEGKLNIVQALDFLRNNLKPPYGKLSNSINEHNRGTKEQIDVFFMKHPDTDKTGVYVFQRVKNSMVIFMHQVTQGRAEAMLALSVGGVRRGPKTIEYIEAANESEPTGFTHQVAQSVDDQVREQFDSMVGQRSATTDTTEAKEEWRALPSLFHHDYQRLSAWLQDNTPNAALGEEIKAHVAALVRGTVPGGIVTEEMMGQVVFTTARMAGTSSDPEAAAGVIQLQMFTADHAGSKPPFGVIDLGTIFQISTVPGGMPAERVSKIFGVRQNPFGATPTALQGGGWKPAGGWGGHPGAARSQWGADAQALFGEQQRREAAGFRPATPTPGLGNWTPHGPLFGGQQHHYRGMHAGGKPETFDVTTSSLNRFMANLNVLIEEQHELFNKQYIEQLKNKVQSTFYNQAASQQGSLLFDLKYMGGHSLLVLVRDRATQLTHFIETIQL